MESRFVVAPQASKVNRESVGADVGGNTSHTA